VETIFNRLLEDTTRPLLQDSNPESKLRSLLQQRQPLYSQADLHITITQEQTPEQIVATILAAIPSVLKTQVSQHQN
jgi:shikimate kinase